MFEEFLFLFTVVNKVLLCLLFLILPSNKKINRLFALLIICPVPMIVNNYFIHMKGESPFILSLINHIFFELYFPLWIIYIEQILGIKKKYSKTTIVLNALFIFTPFIIFAIQPFLGEKNFENFRQAQIHGTTNIMYFLGYGVAVSIALFYTGYMMWRYITISRNKEQYAYLRNAAVRLNYIKNFALVNLSIVIAFILSLLIFGAVNTEIYTFQILLDIYIFYFIYEGFVTGIITLDFSEKDVKSNSSGEDLYNKILHSVVEQRLHLDPNIDIATVAEKIDIPKYKISKVLSENDKNFNSLINEMRIDEFLKQYDSTLYSIESLAMECGFNSKATFNRVFKQTKGFTPSQFIKNEVKKVSN